MLRSLLISLTILSTTLGSLGLPVYLHTCRMMEEVSAIPECSMCQRSTHEDGAEATHDDSDCCQTSVANQRSDDSTLPKVELQTAPLFVALAVYVAHEAGLLGTPDQAPRGCNDSPPGLAMRAQETYLLNSTFLI